MVDKSRSRENGGSGIGLSLCKKIVEMHGSKLSIHSEEGIGTTVSFEVDVEKEEDWFMKNMLICFVVILIIAFTFVLPNILFKI